MAERSKAYIWNDEEAENVGYLIRNRCQWLTGPEVRTILTDAQEYITRGGNAEKYERIKRRWCLSTELACMRLLLDTDSHEKAFDAVTVYTDAMRIMAPVEVSA